MENYEIEEYMEEYKKKIAKMTKEELKVEWDRVVNELKKPRIRIIRPDSNRPRNTASGHTF